MASAKKDTKPKAKSKSKPRPNPATRKVGLYQNDEKQCAEITTQYGRCKHNAMTGTMFCKLHQRRPHGHEDDFFDSTFSCVYGNVWIGSLDTTNDPKALKAAGIRNIVNISGWEPKPKTRDMYKRLGINYHTLTHRDRNGRVQFLGDEPIRNVNNFYWYMDKGVDIMRGLKGTTLVNCHAGVNRSASLVAAYLMAVHGMSYERAEALLKRANAKRRVPCLTNRYFVAALKRYPEHLQEMARKKKVSALM